MLKRISRARFLLFVLALPFCLIFSGLPDFSGNSPDNNIPHSLQLLTLLEQEAYEPVKAKIALHNDRSNLRTLQATHWNTGLNAFREGKMRLAAENFSAVLSASDQLSSSDRATAAFWTYRAFAALGDKVSAPLYLDKAANEKPGFYSTIARRVSGRENISASINDAKTAALYPMPKWTPSSGYQVEPALLFAIMRQESEFDPAAQSTKGAIGVMQIMPSTARALARNINVSGSIAEPSVSMALGQQYLKQLMEYPFIQNNMVYLLSAYNAGPAMVEKWQQTLSYNSDPLLFIETIPYNATRDYVVNVMGNYWVYADLFGASGNTSVTALSESRWPQYAGPAKQSVTARN